MRNKDFSGTLSHDMLEQKDLDAARVLMDLRNDAGWVSPVLQEATITKKRDLWKKLSSITSIFDSGFSIIHFLSAVRVVLMTPVAEPHERDSCINASKCAQRKLPALTTQEIVQLVKSNPGDARIFELRVSIQDLVLGVLRIFSSTTAPSGVSSWQPLSVYEKSSKHWSWIGPMPSHLPHSDHISTSPEAWGLRGQTVSKLVDCFAEWLIASKNMLQKIESLPPPPLSFMLSSSSSERFNTTRNLKISISTISPSCEQVRDYFQKEEALRYLIPEKPFSYTAIDGKRTSVAPLRRCSGKPSRKARDHFILKRNRPPCFTVLCLVRDAAARLPDGMGTRSDICILVRDSAFIMEDIADDQVEQVVSGALDRLHYELDPCLTFDRESRLWVYLHGNREEEDFDDYGTYSTKIRKKERLQYLVRDRRRHV